MVGKAQGSEIEIQIPELEEAMASFKPHTPFWTEKEIAIVSKYYGKVPLAKLKEHLPMRSEHAIQHKARQLGLHTR